MKLGIIGEPCVDYIHREGKAVTKHLGGILYSVVSLAVIAGKHDEVYPIMNLGEDEFDNITSFLSRFDKIKFDFIFKNTHKTRIVKLYYRTGSTEAICGGSVKDITYEREESSTEPALPLSLKQIKPALEIMDGILVNMVSGQDIQLETLLRLRKEFSAYIHMDIHNIVMKTEANGSRLRRPVNKWLDWCTNCDTLQMNEGEISSISEENLNEYEIAERILWDGKVKSLAVTRGNRGVTMYQKKTKSAPERIYTDLDKIDIASIETKRFKDSTGCGDVFAAAFFFKSIENNLSDLPSSLHYANRLASRKAELNGVEELENLV